ncbi:MAG TPA: hypothetical protein VG944_04080 [Fimbriimonas sp.]|nr:hypothetical protein [Fimbriimonas sp.]
MCFVRLYQVAGLLLLLGATAAAQNSKLVTLETTGESADKLVGEIAAQTGLNLKADSAMGREIVAARLTNVPSDQALRKVAETLNATWIQEDGTYRLTRTAAQLKTEQAAEEMRLARGYAETIAQRRKSLAALPPFDEQEAIRFADLVKRAMDNASDPRSGDILQALQQQGPSGRTFGRILGSIDPHDLAGLPEQVKVVYSTDPTPTERQMPSGVTDIVEEFLREQSLWAHEVQARHLESDIRSAFTYDLPMDVDSPNLNASTPAKMLLTAFEFRKDGPVNLELMLADGKGNIIGRSSDSISPTFLDPQPPKSSAGDKPVELPESLFQLISTFEKPSHLDNETRQKLLHPEQVEPLGLAAGPLLIQCANAAKENLVAVLSDANLTGGIRAGAKNLTVDAYLTQLSREGNDIENDGAWLTVKPLNPGFTRDNRVDRAVLGEMVRARESERDLDVDQQAKYALALPLPLDNSLPNQISAILRGEPTPLTDVSCLRFYGSLTQAQRESAQSQEGLSVAILSEAQKNLLEPIVYGSFSDLRSRPGAPQVNGIWRIPTELLPDGIPNNSVVHLAQSSSDAVFNTKDNPFHRAMSEGAYSPGELASQIFAKNYPQKATWFKGTPLDPSQAIFKLGSVETYRLSIAFPKGHYVESEMKARKLAGGDPVALTGLPASFQNEVQNALASLVKDLSQEPPSKPGVTGP